MQRPIEEYLKHSDTLAQDMVNAWGLNMLAGNGPLLSAEFKEVFETTCQFRTAKMIADNWRRAGIPTEPVDTEVEAKRQVFAHAYCSSGTQRCSVVINTSHRLFSCVEGGIEGRTKGTWR